jgi:hypothetical protein
MYAMSIEDYSSEQLEKIFDKHIDAEAKITTDLWRGYRPLSEKSYKINQLRSVDNCIYLY